MFWYKNWIYTQTTDLHKRKTIQWNCIISFEKNNHRGVQLTAHLHPVWRLTTRGAIPPLPLMLSYAWLCGAAEVCSDEPININTFITCAPDWVSSSVHPSEKKKAECDILNDFYGYLHASYTPSCSGKHLILYYSCRPTVRFISPQ
jgi:hypothetical protein